MGYRDTEKSHDIKSWLQVWEDQGPSLTERLIKQCKADRGRPICNADQLTKLSLRHGESKVIREIYDRFTPRLKADKRSTTE